MGGEKTEETGVEKQDSEPMEQEMERDLLLHRKK